MEPVKEKVRIIDIILTLIGISAITLCCLYKANQGIPSFKVADVFNKASKVQSKSTLLERKNQTIAVADNVDFGSYMNEMQRTIKRHWDPPKEMESKRVVLLYKIAKDGKLLSYRILESSGLSSMDSAAINALKASAPFKPLPSEFKGQSIDVSFTFAYNVLKSQQ